MKQNLAATITERAETPTTRKMTLGDALELCRRYRHRAALLGALADRACEFESGDTGPARFLLVDGSGRQEPFAEEVVEAARIELRTLAELAQARAREVADLVLDVPIGLADVELGALSSDEDIARDAVIPNHERRSGQK
jgi:hypothetical protein